MAVIGVSRIGWGLVWLLAGLVVWFFYFILGVLDVFIGLFERLGRRRVFSSICFMSIG